MRALWDRMILNYWAKNKASAFVSLDGLCWGVLPLSTLRHLFPFGETELSEAETEELKELLRRRAWQLLLDYLARQEHSKLECNNYLKRHQFHPSIIESCIRQATEKNFLNDNRFAGLYIQSLFERGKSRRQIIVKLKEKGITEAIYEELLEELADPAAQRELLKEQIEALKYRHRELAPPKRREKVFSSLYRKGFSLDEISEVYDE